jgi:PAS domain S-box-containing protein
MPPASHPTGFHGEFGNGSQSVHRGDFHAPDGTLGAAIEKLIERLLCITVEEAGAERGVLLLMRGDSLRIAAEAATTGDAFAVRVHDARIEPALLPESVVQYVARTQESVLLDDAGAQGSFRDDEYIARGCARSILCLPLLKQPRLVAVLYLENKLGAGIFANARTGVLEGLASAAAISLENSRLDRDLQERETRLRIAENAARQSEKELRDVVGSMPAMVWSALADGRCVFVNRRWRDFTGLSPEDALGWNWQKAVHPDDLAGFRVEWVTALNTGQAMETEVRIRRTDGEYHWFFVRGVPSLDEAGNVLKWYGTSIDIEDRKRAEQKLRESEFYLAESQRLSKTGSWAANSAGIRHWSEENFRIWGFDPQGGLPSHEERSQRVHPEDQLKFAAHVEKMRREKKDSETEYRLIRPDGRVGNIHTTAHVVLSPSGDFVEAIGTTTDVTERKQAEEALRTSEKELRDLFENMPAIACVMLPDGTHPYLTRQWADYTGLSVEQTGHEGLANVVHPEEAASLLEKVRTAMVCGKAFEHEARFRRAADGEYRWFMVRAKPLLDDTGTPVKLYGMMIDIEDRMRAEEAVRRTEKELRDLLEKMPAIAFSARPDGFNDFQSQKWLEYSGLQMEASEGHGWHAAVHPDDLDSHLRNWAASRASGEPFEDEVRHRSATGEYRWFLTRAVPLRDERGKIVKWLGVLADIEDRKRAEEAVKRSEAYLAQAQKLTRTGSWVYKPGSDRPSYFSDEMFRLYGLSPEDKPAATGIIPSGVVPEDFVKWRVLAGRLRNGSCKAPAEIDYRWMAADGSVRHFHTVISPVLDQVGEVVEYIGTSMDITERKLAEQALRRSEASRTEERARFAREIHDTLAQGFTGILMQLGAASQVPGDSRRDISAHLNAIDSLARSSLAEARRSVATLRPVGPTDYTLAECIEQLIRRVRIQTSAGLSLAIDGEAMPLQTRVANELFRITQEALNNALAHSGASRISVSVSFQHDNAIRISIKDDGRGFDMAARPPADHFGLVGMQERASSVGASLTIVSESGSGTQVIVQYRKI